MRADLEWYANLFFAAFLSHGFIILVVEPIDFPQVRASLPHDSILAVLEFYGMLESWLAFSRNT